MVLECSSQELELWVRLVPIPGRKVMIQQGCRSEPSVRVGCLSLLSDPTCGLSSEVTALISASSVFVPSSPSLLPLCLMKSWGRSNKTNVFLEWVSANILERLKLGSQSITCWLCDFRQGTNFCASISLSEKWDNSSSYLHKGIVLNMMILA